MKEIITPHKISILVLIKTFGEMKLKYLKEKQSKPPVQASTSTAVDDVCNARYRRNYCMLMLHLIQGPDMTLSDLYNLLQRNESALFPKFLATFHKHIGTISGLGIEGLLELVRRVGLLMAEPTHVMPIVTKTSVLGLYIRRCVVMFERMSCSEVVEVFKAFAVYFRTAPKLEEPEEVPTVVLEKVEDEEEPMVQVPQSPTTVSDFSKENGFLWTRRQAELFLAQQSALILKNEATAMPPVELHARIQQLLKANPDCSEAYFLSYLNFLRVRDFCGSLHSLYHCFDRGAGFHVDPKLGVPPVTGSSEDKARSFRYGALNLAMFYANFGHKNEAMLALKECVMLAHGSSCNFCLQHALCWLYRLCDESKVVLMERSITRSNELSLSYLSSLGIQALAQHSAYSSNTPAIVFEMLTKSDILNCQHSMLDLAANSYALKATLWCTFGRPAMAGLFSQLLLHSEAQDYSGEAACLAVCQLATQLMAEGECQLSAMMLWHVRLRFPQISTQRLWVHTEQVLGFGRSMREGHWQEARRAAEQLAATDQWESTLRVAELRLVQGDGEAALTTLGPLLEHCQSTLEVMPSLLVRSTLLTTRVMGGCPAGVTRLLVNALSLSRSRNLTALSCLVTLQLAEHQLAMGLGWQALRLVNCVMLLVLAHGGMVEQGAALLLQAKCRVAVADQGNKTAWSNTLAEAIDTLERAKAKFEKMQAISKVKEVLLFQILLHLLRGEHTEKLKLALELRLLEEQIASKMTSSV